MEICIYFKKANLVTLLDSFKTLQKAHEPIYYSENEKSSRIDGKMSNDTQFDNFILNNPKGFFLHGENCLYDLTLSESGYSNLCIYLNGYSSSTPIDEIFSVLASSNPEFGYAVDEKEFQHRNRIYTTQGGSDIESWVGRDLNEYIPGLYCYTLISVKQLQEKGIEPSELENHAISTRQLNQDTMLFQFFENLSDWKSHHEKLDKLCEDLSGIFCKNEIEKIAKATSNFIELSGELAKWK